jgi:hypothetical protein
MKKKVFAVQLLLIVNLTYSQDIRHNISQKEATLLLREINPKKAANRKVEPLVRLSLYNISKGGEIRPISTVQRLKSIIIKEGDYA